MKRIKITEKAYEKWCKTFNIIGIILFFGVIYLCSTFVDEGNMGPAMFGVMFVSFAVAIITTQGLYNLLDKVTKIKVVFDDYEFSPVNELNAIITSINDSPGYEHPGMDEYRFEQIERVKKAFVDPGSRERIIFHGGCIGCATPATKGIGNCRRCQYFNADWDKPDLSTKEK